VLTLRERTLEQERLLLEHEAAQLGGELRGPSFERELEGVRQRREQLRDALPVRAPDDLCLIGSTRLFDEVERKVAQVGRRLDPQLPEDAPAAARLIVEYLAAVMVEIDPHEQMPAHTTDPEDDYLIEMAYRADAFAIVSRDRAVVPERTMTWTDERRGVSVPGYWQSAFVETHVENSGFTLDDVDPRLLTRLIEPNQ
jgi:predicted nucleic acid-binding protein